MEKHIENLRQFNVPLVVALNRFTGDTEEKVKIVKQRCHELNVNFVDSNDKGIAPEMDNFWRYLVNLSTFNFINVFMIYHLVGWAPARGCVLSFLWRRLQKNSPDRQT